MHTFGRIPLLSCLFLIFAIRYTKCHSSNDIRIISTRLPPDPKKYVAMARYVIHKAEWVSLAAHSNIPKIKGYPFSSVESMSDGTVDKSIGIPYFYLTLSAFTIRDLQKDNRCSISATLEQTSYCHDHEYDPEDPRCARVMLSGRMIRVDNSTEEYSFAENAILTRHPFMKDFPKDHNFFVAKLALENIVIVDQFGGPINIDIEEYLAYNDTKIYD